VAVRQGCQTQGNSQEKKIAILLRRIEQK
jgi:hypothetical protein